MDASNWINLGLLIVAVLAAFVAILQVIEARRVRADTEAARDEAQMLERRTIDAAERAAISAANSAESQSRIARATEEQAQLAAELAAREDPWTFLNLGPRNSDQRWEITNRSGKTALKVNITSSEPDWVVLGQEGEYWTIAHGETIEFTFLQRLSSPRSASIRVSWVPWRSTDETREFVKRINASDNLVGGIVESHP